ncbi:MAG TPA: phenylalanine--tRNA ligase subunit beta, partial [Longimicrobiaceae bacterium]|nr:phenylalanine--tRNA ligase subunit beta [Longimicrobiaceae bacterium]
MNISYSWLKDLAPSITDSPHELAERLGMLGAPVDELIELGEGLSDIVVARVDEVLPHPNADRLRICVVRGGSDDALQVVCGAPNVVAGGYYPFAPVGATLPGGMTIRKAKLRGEASEGMLCSARELGLGRDADGLMTLTGEWSPGAPLIEALSLDDARLVLDITPNRPDLLSHLGVARELAPRGAADAALPALPGGSPVELRADRAGVDGEIDGVDLSIKDQEGCPRYMAAVVRGVAVAPSPEWLASRLRAVGVRPINNVVDATNYVLMEVGQPLHAFDLERIDGPAIAVRRAKDGERIRTLDGVDRKLQPNMLVIADRSRPVAVAGVMGGADTEVTDATTDLLIEGALFDERTVRSTARELGLSTDASYRFERGVDADGLPRALSRVVELILAVAGGVAAPGMADLYPQVRILDVVTVRTQTVARVLGLSLSSGEISDLLKPIGFKVAGDSEMRVTVPGFRPDVTREIDVIEEIARRHGYDAFPESLPAFRPGNTPEDPRVAVEKRVRERLTGWGFLEARTTAFAPASDIRVPLLNPLSAEESHLRDLLAPGLLRRLEYNWSHGLRDIRLFEIGTVFLPGAPGGLPVEQSRVAAVFTGRRTPPHWTGDNEIWDIWDLSALLSELAGELG